MLRKRFDEEAVVTVESDDILCEDDVLSADERVGRNEFRTGSRIPDRPGDGSLPRGRRVQRPLPPESLVWKYFGDLRMSFFVLRTAAMENMWPQLGQGVSDHSQLFGDKANFAERGRRSQQIIAGVVYSSEDDAAKKQGIRIRNFHKSIKGEMPKERTYHAINPETYYWAHVTFFDNIFRTVDLLYPTPLTRAEKEQIFDESKDWFSLYGVDDSAQPQSYDEFISYREDVVNNMLVDSTVARYTVGFATKDIPPPPNLPPLVRKLLWHRISRLVRLTNIGAMEPILRERLEVEWSRADEKNFERFCGIMRRISPIFEALPLKYRYMPAAVRAFRREGIDPRDITVDSARTALARASGKTVHDPVLVS